MKFIEPRLQISTREEYENIMLELEKLTVPFEIAFIDTGPNGTIPTFIVDDSPQQTHIPKLQI